MMSFEELVKKARYRTAQQCANTERTDQLGPFVKVGAVKLDRLRADGLTGIKIAQ